MSKGENLTADEFEQKRNKYIYKISNDHWDYVSSVIQIHDEETEKFVNKLLEYTRIGELNLKCAKELLHIYLVSMNKVSGYHYVRAMFHGAKHAFEGDFGK